MRTDSPRFFATPEGGGVRAARARRLPGKAYAEGPSYPFSFREIWRSTGSVSQTPGVGRPGTTSRHARPLPYSSPAPSPLDTTRRASKIRPHRVPLVLIAAPGAESLRARRAVLGLPMLPPPSPPPILGIASAQPLSPLTTMEVGGPARFLGAPRTEAALIAMVRWARACDVPVVILGGGSNVIVSDAGLDALVIRPHLTDLSTMISGDHVLVDAGSGIVWDALVRHCAASGLLGLECLSGIPGSVGATPIQNVGAYGRQVGELVESVRVYDMRADEVLELSAEQCQFSYRSSVFKGAGRHWVVLQVRFALSARGQPVIRYPELARALEAHGQQAAPRAVREAVLDIRRRKSMVIEPEDENRRSCGSFFLNPVVDAETLARVQDAAREPPPSYPQGEAQYKLPAAWLIERAGLGKGHRFGKTRLSTRHALALTCQAGATAGDVVAAARQVVRTVEDRFGLRLQPEPQFLGFERFEGGLPV